MRSIFVFLTITLISITDGYKLAPYDAKNCTLMLPFNHQQTVVIDLVGDSHIDLKTCILQNIISEQAIVLLNEYYINKNISGHRRKTTENPNFIIMTKNLSTDLLVINSIRTTLKSHRSLVYFILINDKTFRCVDGGLNTTDFLTLEKFMNQLWHTYKIMRVGVIFAFSCKGKIAIYTGKRKSNKILYDRTITVIDLKNDILEIMQDNANLLSEDYPLRINIFYRYPTAITECGKLYYYTSPNLEFTGGYCGLDALVMRDIAQHFKFSLYFIEDYKCEGYGYVAHKNISGSLGCVVRNKIDISFNSRFMTMYSKDNIYFLHYVTTSAICGLVKQADKVPLWQYAISAYRLNLWFMILSLIVAIGLLTWAIETLKYKDSAKKISTFYLYIEDSFTSIMFGFSLKNKRKLYLLKCTCLWSSILFGTIYQSQINYMFTTLLRFENIKTLDGLYKSGNTLYVTHSIREIVKQLRNPDNKLQCDFIMGARLIPDNYTLGLLLKQPRAAFIGRYKDATVEIFSQHKDENGSPLIYIVDECFYTYYLSFITRYGFPFYEEMQRFMQRVGEAGLPLIYEKWTYHMLGMPHSLPKMHKEPRPFAKIKLENQRIPFGILILGYILSLIIFVIEIVKGRRIR